MFRNDLLGTGNNSLASLLIDFRDAYNNMNSDNIVSQNTNNGITIGHAEVKMEVSQMNNDYDA